MSEMRPVAFSKQEVREQMLRHLQHLATYWANLPNLTPQERCEGVVFSTLSMLDGSTLLPAFELVTCPHPDDKAFLIEEGKNWYEPTVINDDAMLHEEYAKLTTK